MSQNLQIFNSPEFGEVRIIEIDGKPYAVGADVARALGYAKPQNAVSLHCPHALKQGIGVQTGTKADGTPAIQNIDMLVIPEGDVYRLIVNSKLPAAEKFERWVFDEVLPSIRKTGVYATDAAIDRIIEDPEHLIRILTELKHERWRRGLLEGEILKLKEANCGLKAKNTKLNEDFMKLDVKNMKLEATLDKLMDHWSSRAGKKYKNTLNLGWTLLPCSKIPGAVCLSPSKQRR